MGIMIKEYTVTGNRRSDTVRALYDTGAGSSFVRRDIADILGEITAAPIPIQFLMADGQGILSVNEVITLNIDVDGRPLTYLFYITDDLAEELIIGADMMQKFKISLDLENEAVTVDPRALYLRA